MERFSEELKKFINNSQWIFAKTYAATWPHHYIVRDRIDENLFIKMVQHIRRFGYEETTIINRCTKENTYEYRLKMGTLPEDKDR